MDELPPDGPLPWTRSCLVCGQDNPRGYRLRSRVEGGRVVVPYTTRATDAGYRDIVHGGVLMTLMDEAMTWAAILAARGVCVMAEMTTRLHRPLPTPMELRVEGWVLRHNRRLLLAAARVVDAAGTLYAEASGKYLPTPPEQGALQMSDFVDAPETAALRRWIART